MFFSNKSSLNMLNLRRNEEVVVVLGRVVLVGPLLIGFQLAE